MFTRNSLAALWFRRTFFLAVFAALTVAAGAVSNPVPIITFLSPVSSNPGGAGFTLTVNGANFVRDVSVVNWRGTALATTFLSSTRLQATVPAAEIASEGTGWITVANPGCGGDCKLTSNIVYLPVANPIPSYTAAALTTAVGNGPSQLAEGDFDGDGKLDLAVSNYEDSSVSILLGNGDGTFQPQSTLSTLAKPFGIAVGDLNGDGIPDLVVGNDSADGGLNIFLGNGSGGFTEGIALEGGHCPRQPVLADINHDGNLDLVVGNSCGIGVEVYLGKGDGTFAAPTLLSGSAGVSSLVVADLNGDGILDLAAASQGTDQLDLYLGVEGGGFERAASITLPGINSLAAADMNSDGKVDLIAASVTSGIHLLRGNGDGTFAPATVVALGGYSAVAAADLNGDGRPDIIAVTNGAVEVLLADGRGAFQAPKTLGHAFSYAIALGHFATAGGLNIAMANYAAGQVDVFLPTGTPQATLSTLSLSFGSPTLHVTGASQSVTLTNTGSAALTGITTRLTGYNRADFRRTNNCPAALAVGSKCTVNVSFAPSLVAAECAVLQFFDNAANSPQVVSLGNGCGMPTLQYVQAPPASLMAGSSIGTISVGVYFANSTLDTGSSASVTVGITGPNSFFESQTVTASAGIATFDFSSVPLDLAGQYTETAVSLGLGSAVSTTTVTPLLSSEQMVVARYPSPTYANVPHPFTVSVTDSFGNLIPSYTGTATLTSSDPNAVLTPTPYTFVSADMGTHTFVGTLLTLGTQTISATDGTLSGSQTGVVVNPRPQFVANLLPDDAGTAPACDGTEACSLRSAVNLANTLGAGDITIDTSQFAGAAPWTSALINGPLELNSNLNLYGPGATLLIISGNNLSGVFQVDAGASAGITGLTVTQGNSAGNGGAINNAGSLRLGDMAVTNSVAADDGGGIYSSGKLGLSASTLSGNTAGGNGGGAATTGTSIFYDNTISGNTASVDGGGIDNSGALSMPQSTLYGNTAADGAGIENEMAGTLVVAQSTLTGNIAIGGSGGTITNQNPAPSAVTILNSIVAGNTAPGGDCVGCGIQVSFNLFNISAATLKLGPLANNGGVTSTLLPLAGSPAIGSGSVALATDSGLPQSLADDQRGSGYIRIVNNSVDLGAVQYNSGPAGSLVLLVTGSPVAGNALSVTLHALTAGGNPDGAYAGTVHFSSTDPQAVLPADYTFVSADDGTHVFTLTLKTSGSQSITATDTVNSSLQAVQTVAVSPAAAAEVAAAAGSGQTALAEAAFPIALSAKVTDAFGNAVPGTTVVFTAPSSGASGMFAGGGRSASVVTGSTGMATAPAFTANNTAGQYSVSATVGELTPAIFTLTNGSLAAGSITAVVAGSAVAGSSLTVTVNAFTASGSPDVTYAGTLHFTSTDPQAVLPADYTFVPSNLGTHVFTLTLKTSGSQSITIADTGNSALHATVTIAVSPAAAAKVAATAGSGQTALAEAAFATLLSAKVTDAFGNAVPGTTVVFTAPSSGASGTFAGGGRSASVVTGSTGVATAPAFTANNTVGQYSVSATVGELTPAIFTLTNGSLAAGSITAVVAGSAVAGSSLTVTVNAFTASGSPDVTYAGTLHFTSTDPQAVLPADYTFVPSNLGTHVFTLTLKTSGSQSITIADTGNSALHVTKTITVSPAAASAVVANAGSGQTAVEGAAFTIPLSAKVSDAFGNAVPGTTVVFTAPSSGASGTFAGGVVSASVATASTGIATAPAFTANTMAGAYSVSATVHGLTPAEFALTNTVPPDYSVTVHPNALTIVQGQAGSTVLTITPVGGLAGTATFTCTGLPAQATCVFVPAKVVMTGNDAVQTVALTINTTGTNGVIAGLRPAPLPWNTTGLLAFLSLPAGLLFFAIPGSCIPRSLKNTEKRRRYVGLLLVLLFGSVTAITMTSCSGASSSVGGSGGTPLGQYSVTVGVSVNGSNSHSALVTTTIVR